MEYWFPLLLKLWSSLQKLYKMKLFISYFYLQTKRLFVKLPSLLLFAVLFFCFTGTAVFFFSKRINFSSSETGRFKVAIAGSLDDPYLNFALETLTKMDSSGESLELLVMTQDKAEKALSKGKLDAYVVVPDGFIDSINCGLNDKKLLFVINDTAGTFNEAVKTKIAEIVSSLIIHSQSGVLSMQYFLTSRELAPSART